MFSLASLSKALPRSTSCLKSQTRFASHQYAPKKQVYRKAHKGKVPIPIGGSTKGTTVEIGDFGLRLKDMGQGLSAKQLQGCEAVIRRVIKVQKGARAFLRPSCNIPVCRKGNETRMGKGKGEFDHWAVRVPVGRILWEIGGGASEEIAREAFRQVANKLPGKYEFVLKGSPPVQGRQAVVSASGVKTAAITETDLILEHDLPKEAVVHQA